MMKEFLDDMVSWASNIDGFQVALEIYEYKEPNDYTREKFHQMQNNFMRRWRPINLLNIFLLKIFIVIREEK